MRLTLLLPPLCFIAGFLLQRRRTRRAEGSLRNSEARYRSVVETQSELVCRYRADGTLTFVNDAYCRYFGRPRGQLIGRRFIELLPESARPGALQYIAALLRGQRPEMHEHEVVRPDGSIGWQQWIDHVIRDAHGGVLEIQGIGRDVTELKQAQHVLEQRQRELTHLTRVAMLGEISGTLAHELHQPLTSILANTQAALRLLNNDSIDPAQIRDILTDVIDQNQHAGDYICRLRDLLERGDTRFQPLDLNAVIGEVVSLARADLLSRGIHVRCDLTTTLPFVYADGVQLQQVVLNLILNARDAMSGTPREQRYLDIRTSHDTAGTAHLSISDCGCGIATDDLERVFDSFHTTKQHGLGLGLSICRSIVGAHSGRLWAVNNAGPGVTFHLTLPAAAPAHALTPTDAIGPKSNIRNEYSV